MKMLALFIVSCFFYTTTTAQDFIYEMDMEAELNYASARKLLCEHLK